MTVLAKEKKKPLINITFLCCGATYGRIYIACQSDFGARRVNTNVSLDNNIPVGSDDLLFLTPTLYKQGYGVNDHTSLNFSMVFHATTSTKLLLNAMPGCQDAGFISGRGIHRRTI